MGPLGKIWVPRKKKAEVHDYEWQNSAILLTKQDTQARDVRTRNLNPQVPEMEPGSRVGTRTSATESESLSRQIWNQLSDSTYAGGLPRKFLPEGTLESVITKNTVLQTLKVEDADPSSDLVVFVYENCKKILATVLYNKCVEGRELLQCMQTFMDEQCCDKNLPLKASDEIFKRLGWGERDMQTGRFCEDQWCFLAPIISTDRRESVTECSMSKHCVLPLYATDTQTGAKNKGSFGQVYKYGIHPNHFKDEVEQLVSRPHVIKQDLMIASGKTKHRPSS